MNSIALQYAADDARAEAEVCEHNARAARIIGDHEAAKRLDARAAGYHQRAEECDAERESLVLRSKVVR